MEMELVGLLKVIWRWKWVTLALILLITLPLGYLALNSEPTYKAVAVLQITTPDREDVFLLDQYSFVSDRDEITIALNNFLETSGNEIVRNRTLETVGVEVDYDLSVDAELAADLVYVEVETSNPPLAAELANAHAIESIRYFGELRSMSAQAAKFHFREQLDIATDELRDAEGKLLNFQIENDIVSFEEELVLQQSLLSQLEEERGTLNLAIITDPAERAEQIASVDSQISDLELQIQQQELEKLRLERSQLLVEKGEALNAEAGQLQGTGIQVQPAEADPEIIQLDQEILAAEIRVQESTIEKLRLDQQNLISEREILTEASKDTSLTTLQELDQLIKQRRERLAELALLEPEFNLLLLDVNQARDKHQLLKERYDETDLRQAYASQANFIQIINPAREPTVPRDNSLQTLIMGAVAAFGLGILLSFLLEYFFKHNEQPEYGEESPYPMGTPRPARQQTLTTLRSLMPGKKAS